MHLETTIELTGDSMEKVALGTSHAVASRDVQYPKSHRAPKVPPVGTAVLVSNESSWGSGLHDERGRNLPF
jgi:hypothetical protein